MANEIDRIADPHAEERIRAQLARIDRDLYRGDESYCQLMLDKICELISVGYTMKEIANITGVNSTTMYRWAWQNKAFSDAMIMARRNQAHVLMDRAAEAVADGVANQREKDAKFSVDAYVRIAEKLNPRKYGVKLVEYSGEQDIRITDEHRTLRILELLAKNDPELVAEAIPEEIAHALPDFSGSEEDDAGTEEGYALEYSADEGNDYRSAEAGRR